MLGYDMNDSSKGNLLPPPQQLKHLDETPLRKVKPDPSNTALSSSSSSSSFSATFKHASSSSHPNQAKIQSLLREISTLRSQTTSIESDLFNLEKEIEKEETEIEEIMLKTMAYEHLSKGLKYQTQVIKESIDELENHAGFNRNTPTMQKINEQIKADFDGLIKQLAPILLTGLTAAQALELRTQIQAFQETWTDPAVLEKLCTERLTANGGISWATAPVVSDAHAPMNAALAETLRLQNKLSEQGTALEEWRTQVKETAKQRAAVPWDAMERRATAACLRWLSQLPKTDATYAPPKRSFPHALSRLPDLQALLMAAQTHLENLSPSSQPSQTSPSPPRYPPFPHAELMSRIQAFKLPDTFSSTFPDFSPWCSTDHALRHISREMQQEQATAIETELLSKLVAEWQQYLHTVLPNTTLTQFIQQHHQEAQRSAARIQSKQNQFMEASTSSELHSQIDKIREEKFEFLEGKPWAKPLSLDSNILEFKQAYLKNYKKTSTS